MKPEDRCQATNRKGEQCGHPQGWGTDNDEGPCKFHGGAGGAVNGGGAQPGNTNGMIHGAYSKSFVEFLTDEEVERVEQAQEILETPEGAQGHARLMAAIAIEQFRRSSDERFLRRYESICDKAGIFPVDELDHSGEIDLSVSLSSEEKEQLDQLFDREVQP